MEKGSPGVSYKVSSLKGRLSGKKKKGGTPSIFGAAGGGLAEPSKEASRLPNSRCQRDGPDPLATEAVSRSAGFSRKNPCRFFLRQVPQPLPAAEARDGGPEDGGSCAAQPGPPPPPMDHACPRYLEKVRAGGGGALGRAHAGHCPFCWGTLVGRRRQAGERTRVFD